MEQLTLSKEGLVLGGGSVGRLDMAHHSPLDVKQQQTNTHSFIHSLSHTHIINNKSDSRPNSAVCFDQPTNRIVFSKSQYGGCLL